nr:CorA family divalent cation transporter [uncultured Holophaga sp.]
MCPAPSQRPPDPSYGSNSVCEPWLRRHLELPESFFDTLHDEAASTRLERDDDALVGVIHDVLYDFRFDPSAVATTSLCVDPRLLLSARLRPLRTMDRLRSAVRAGQTFDSPEDVRELQQSAEEFSAAVGDAGALIERVKLLQEELSALVNEESNRTLFLLTVVTVIALPINLVGGIPFTAHNHGFTVIVVGLILLTTLLADLALARQRGR